MKFETFLIIFTIVFNIIIILEVRKLDKKRRESQEIFEKWLFDSLYCINSKILLPTVHEKKEPVRFAKVYVPSEDGRCEMTGQDEGWFK